MARPANFQNFYDFSFFVVLQVQTADLAPTWYEPDIKSIQQLTYETHGVHWGKKLNVLKLKSLSEKDLNRIPPPAKKNRDLSQKQ